MKKYSPGWMDGRKSRFKDCLQQSKMNLVDLGCTQLEKLCPTGLALVTPSLQQSETHQIFPSWQYKWILSVHQPPQAALDRHQDVLGLESKYCKGKQTLAKVEETVKEDQLQVDAAHSIHHQGPHAESNPCANENLLQKGYFFFINVGGIRWPLYYLQHFTVLLIIFV